MNRPEKYILSWLKYITEFLSFVIFSYIFLSHLIRLVKPVELYIDQRAFDISYLRFLFFLGCILGAIGWTIAFFEDRKRLKISAPFSQDIKENISYALTALFLAVFYNGVFAFLGIFQYPFFIFLLVFFYLLIPQLVNFYLSFNFSDFRKLLYETIAFRRELIKMVEKIGEKVSLAGKTMAKSSQQISQRTMKIEGKIVESHDRITKRDIEKTGRITKNTLTYIFLLAFILFSLFVTVFSFLLVSEIISEFIQGKTYKENLIRKQLHITKITPAKAIHTQRVLVEGYNFGWKREADTRYKIMSTDGPIRLLEEWTNERLEFIVSLETPVGRKNLWIERPTDNPRNKKVVKSNMVTLDVMSRFVLYPESGDTKFERGLKKLKRILFFNFPLFNNLLFASYE